MKPTFVSLMGVFSEVVALYCFFPSWQPLLVNFNSHSLLDYCFYARIPPKSINANLPIRFKQTVCYVLVKDVPWHFFKLIIYSTEPKKLPSFSTQFANIGLNFILSSTFILLNFWLKMEVDKSSLGGAEKKDYCRQKLVVFNILYFIP